MSRNINLSISKIDVVLLDIIVDAIAVSPISDIIFIGSFLSVFSIRDLRLEQPLVLTDCEVVTPNLEPEPSPDNTQPALPIDPSTGFGGWRRCQQGSGD